jgi:peptidyl-prolyl cis-trans isomerase A (cyclophilin A)
MRNFVVTTLALLLLMASGSLPAQAADSVVMETSHGSIIVELDRGQAPVSVANFLAYVDAGFYDGTIFHRVIPDFMIQGGGFTEDLKQKPTRPAIKNEAGNGLRNLRGTLSMARTNVVDSATSQFFINHKDNPFLDHRAPNPKDFGYAVFGRVSSGMEVVDRIASVQTRGTNPMFQNLPVQTVVIKSGRRVTQ